MHQYIYGHPGESTAPVLCQTDPIPNFNNPNCISWNELCQCSSAVTIIDIDINIAIYFRYQSISISRYMLVFQPRLSLQWFDALHRCADCARFDQNPRTHADANFRIRASLMLCSSRPSATRRQTDAISLLSTPCAAPTPLRLIVSYVISPSPAAVVRLAGGCVLFSESTLILQLLSRINL